MPVKYGNYKTALDRSQLRMVSSEGEMEYNTSQVLGAAGSVNKTLGLRFENPGSGKNLDFIMNESGPGDSGTVGME